MMDAVLNNKSECAINVRNPYSMRPYQHALEIAMKQYEDVRYSGYYNVGSDDCD